MAPAPALAAASGRTVNVGAILDNADAVVGLLLMAFIAVGVFLIILGVQGLRANHYRPHSYPASNIAACLAVGVLLISPWFVYELIADTLSFSILTSSGSQAPTAYSLPPGTHPLAVEARIAGYNPSPGSYFGRFISERGFRYLVILMNLLGVWFFLKGIYCWRYAGSVSKPPGFERPVAKGITHILGAVILINLLDVGCGVSVLFGSTMLCST